MLNIDIIILIFVDRLLQVFFNSIIYCVAICLNDCHDYCNSR